jgi:hypothetical protein
LGLITINLDDEFISKIGYRAEEAGMSFSRYVNKMLLSQEENRWSDEFLLLLGSMKDSAVGRPAQPPYARDSGRESYDISL